MKTKIQSIFATLAILMLVVSLVPFASTAQAEVPGTMEWRRVDTPGTSGYVISSNAAVWPAYAASEVSQIAVGGDGKTIYAVDAVNFSFYRSTDGGATWMDLTARMNAAAPVAAWTPPLAVRVVATPPDKPSFVAVGGTDAAAVETVLFSVDGGANWGFTGPFPASVLGAITSIDIARSIPGGLGTITNFAVGTADGAGGGTVARLEVGAVAVGWVDTATYPGGAYADVWAVKFSPMFPADRTLLAVVDDDAGNLPAPATNDFALMAANLGAVPAWNPAAIFPGYPVSLDYAGVDSIDGRMVGADMALPSDYMGMSAAARRVWVAIDANGLGGIIDDVYRVDNTTVVRLDTAAGGPMRIFSVAYHGTYADGKLLAGRVTLNQVLRTTNPGARFPDWRTSTKPPTGPGAPLSPVFVRWAPDGKKAFAGTQTVGGAGYDESAFSVTIDGGVSWNQLSLIDTDIDDPVNGINSGTSVFRDIAVSADGKTIYLASSSTASRDSIWRSDSVPIGNRWERVRATPWGGNTALLRLSPEDPKGGVMWEVQTGVGGAGVTWYTVNRGQTWDPRATNVTNIRDFAAASNKEAYVLDGPTGFVAKSTDTGWVWETSVDSRVGAANMITVVPGTSPAHLLVGGTTGRASYSTDAGASYTLIPVAWGTGNVELVADTHYLVPGVRKDVIYAGSSTAGVGIGRWKIGVSTFWETIVARSATQVFTGVVEHCGTLYGGARGVAADRGVERSLAPHTLFPPGPVWELMNVPAAAMTATFASLQPQSIKVSDDVIVWTIDSAAPDCIMAYTDTISKAGPTLTAPATGALIAYDPATGRVVDVVLTWAPLSTATHYQVQIAYDAAFTNVIANIGALAPFYAPPSPTAPTLSTFALGIVLPAGKEYFWRVRVRNEVGGDAIMSPWSAVWSFKTETGVPIRAPYPGPQALAPAPGATLTYAHGVEALPALSWSPEPGTVAKKYKIVIATDPALTKTVDGTPKEVTTTAYHVGTDLAAGTYFWQVQATDPVGNPSAAFNFTVVKLPPPPPPPPPPVTPSWVWVVIGIGALLVIVTLILIVRTGRRA